MLSGTAYAADEVKIIINKKVNKLAYIKNGVTVKILPVATGRSPGLTPEGSFKVVKKLVWPYYTKLKIPGGSPRNPLGARWLGLDACDTSGGTYGIHGTSNPKSIGKRASGGCIRMFNEDVIWLYNNTPLNTPVEIMNKDWVLNQKPVTIVIEGKTITPVGASGAYMVNDTVLVPCRLVAETMGCTVSWDETKQQVTVSSGNNAFSATVNSTALYFNGSLRPMKVAAALKASIVYLPVRVFADVFGYQAAWDNNTYTVSLTKAG
ncbi:MAG: L,D-transpeptidase family protein [Eubacteriales bacterium]